MATPQLPLTLRKKIRDCEGPKKEYLAAIEAAFGVTGITFECDYAACYAALVQGSKDQIADVVDAYLKEWLYYNKKYLEDELVKKWWLRDWTSKKIVFRIAKPKAFDGYARQVFEGGVLYWETKPDTYYCNVSEIGNMPIGFTGNLALARNERDNEEKRVQNLERIAKASKVPQCTLEIVDKDKVLVVCKDRGYEDRLGEVIYDWYLTALAENVEKLCADDMAQEAFAEKWTTHKIIFRINEKHPGSYVNVMFENGNLIIEVKASDMATNVSNTGSELEKLL
jgi:hypothetical protein